MASLEVNKACAAVLVAGVAFMFSTVVGDMLVHAPRLAKPAIAIAAPEGSGTTAAPEDPPVALLLASADPAKGKTDTASAGCVACHSFDEGGKAGIGPNLYGVLGAPHGHMAGYDYSAALKAKQGPWTYDELYEWLKKPSAYAPGTKMTFAGLSNAKERADIIDYLHTLAQSPEPLPTPPAAAPEAAAGGAKSFDAMVASADVHKGQLQTLQSGCIACHTFDQGGKAGLGPNLYGVVGGPHAHMQGFDYSAALKAHTGPWTLDELNKWLTKPAAYAPGTKMTFAGLPKEEDRANVVAYLRSLSPNPIPIPGAEGKPPATPAAATGQQVTQPSANQNQPQTEQSQSQQPPNAAPAPPKQ